METLATSRTHDCTPYPPVTLPEPVPLALLGPLSQRRTDVLSVLIRSALVVLLRYVPAEHDRENTLRAFPHAPKNSVPFLQPRNRVVERMAKVLLEVFPLVIFPPLREAVRSGGWQGEALKDVCLAARLFAEPLAWVRQWMAQVPGAADDWRLRKMAYVLEQVVSAEKHSLATLQRLALTAGVGTGTRSSCIGQ